MKCLICNEPIIYYRTFSNLFDIYKYQKCDRCFKKYPLDLAIEDYYLDNKTLICYALFNRLLNINQKAFDKEYERLFVHVYRHYPSNDYIFLLYDQFLLSEKNYHLFRQISTLSSCGILIISYFLSN